MERSGQLQVHTLADTNRSKIQACLLTNLGIMCTFQLQFRTLTLL